ncbi:MAG: large repetitive protein, partial [Acidimicrobiaceae bacterium]|nr:large repetitive protein [Acidimicrobiaceae bacterium]
MKISAGLSRRRRFLTATVLALVGALTFSVAGALADAGNPISGTIKANAVDNGNNTITVYVRGQWNWLSHTTDCNFDRAATGVGIVWNDSTEPGYTVAKNGISADIGVSSLRNGDAVNLIDEMVHPTDRGNQVEGYTVAGTDYPASQLFVDPAPNAPPTAAALAAWRGGCGRQPLTATASKGANPERSQQTCADGTVTCSTHPWGSWGYEKNAGLGYSHTYLASALPSKVCVNFYDVHGGGNAGDPKFQQPNNVNEITVDGNSDNSIETNMFNIADGMNCISLVTPPVTTDIHNAAHQIVTAVEAGSTVHDFITVSGPKSGNVTVDWFTNNTCSGTPQSTSAPVALNANGQAEMTAFAKGPLAAGLFGFKAHFLGGGIYLPSAGACEPLRVVDANIQITPATAINPIGTTHTLTGHVNVNSGSGFANAPNGTTINFSLTGPASFVGPSSCTTAGGTGSCTVVISSSTSGTSTIKASTDVTINGVALHRASGDGKAGDSADAAKLWANDSARTDILNASGTVVTSVVTGTVVHDKVFVSRDAATPAGVPDPTGSVIFHRFATIDCTGSAINQTVALTPGSPSTAITSDFAPTANMSYQAEYLGDANYPARTAACEPLTVTPLPPTTPPLTPAPAIGIVKNPKGQTVAVGGTATFSITVTNIGNVTLTNVTVSDPLTTSCNRTKTDIPALASMAPGASITYTCTKTNVRAAFDNVATATGTPPSGPNVTASDTAPVKTKALTPAKKKKAVKSNKKNAHP